MKIKELIQNSPFKLSPLMVNKVRGIAGLSRANFGV
jgi:hypothetical protein